MYRKKEILGIFLILSILLIWYAVANIPKKKTEDVEKNIEAKEQIIIKIKGEVVRPMQLQYSKAICYGVLFLRIENSLNEFSDLSSFDYEEIITSSKTIVIPTYDVDNNYMPNEKIYIHQATLEELKKLPQVGNKRGQKILDYIKEHGRIVSWDVFFKIVSVPDSVKETIKKQAVL